MTAAAPHATRSTGAPSTPFAAFLATGATAFSELVQAAGRRLVPAPAGLMSMTVGYQLTSRAISAAAELGLVDLLADGPRTIPALAEEAGVDADALERLMRLLEAGGLVRTSRRGQLSLTRRALPLRADHPQSVRDWCRYLGADWHWELWGELDDCVRDGRTAYERRFGCDFFSWFSTRPVEADAFDAAMRSFSSIVDRPVADACDLRGLGDVVDVAGGSGALLAALLERDPALRGTLFDRSDVLARAQLPSAPLVRSGLGARASFVAGNMFESVPEGHGAYVLKWILHDWDDRTASAILSRVAAASKPGARLFVVEMLIERGRHANAARQLDLAMLTLTGGRERTRDQLEDLIRSAGFEPRGARRTASPMRVLEASRSAHG
jgi:O-methyltransferase domain